MSSVVISGDTSGAITVSAPAVSGTNTLTLQAATATSAVNTLGTAVASTSGTSIDFTSLPAWIKRITVMFNAVSLSSTANILIQGGVGGVIDSTGYASGSMLTNGAGSGSTVSSTAGYIMRIAGAAASCSGHMVLTLLGSNIWVSSHSATYDASTACLTGGGTNTFSGTLDTIRITTTSTDTFDAGSINILYEG
jgi:hypothetical protein